MNTEDWYSVPCSHCYKQNWLYVGDLWDLTASDPDSFQCWSCGERTILFEDGKRLGLFEEWGYCVDGFKEPR